ncbi:hypothetical protein [Shewanella sp.]|uniref:hypothetical protein n=1 Tax=Shewanella sp. TaxID=50422 RepID=UPI003A96FFB6
MHSVQTRDGAIDIGGRSNGAMAIAAMRKMLGKSSLASIYDALTEQQRATVLYAARIRPSSAINTPLMAMSMDDREAIRVAIIALTDMSKAFLSVPCGRDQIISQRPSNTLLHPKNTTSANEQTLADKQLLVINKLTKELAEEINQRKTA